LHVQVDHLQEFPYTDEHDPLRVCGGFRLDPIIHLPGILRTKFLPRFITQANGMLQVDLTDQEIQQKRSISTIGTYGPDVRDHVPVFWHPRNPATYRMITSANTRGINLVFSEFKTSLLALDSNTLRRCRNTSRAASCSAGTRLMASLRLHGTSSMSADCFCRRSCLSLAGLA
jgi:hypothetical protein